MSTKSFFKRFIITGGLGFIGFNLIEKITKEFPSSNILILDNLSTGSTNKVPNSKNINFINFTLKNNNINSLSKILNEDDLIIHLAAFGNVIESIQNAFPSFEANVEGTLCVLNAMKIAKTKKIIFSSTGGALMGNTKPPVDETSIPSPISPYGASKLAAEGYIRSFTECEEMKSIICRFGNVYGKYSLHKKGVVNKFIISALNEKVLTVRGDGNSTRDYIHVSDITSGIINCINYINNLYPKEVLTLHLANSSEVSLNELINTIQQVHGEKLLLENIPEVKGEVKRNASLSSLANKKINFQPEIKLIEGIKELYSWLKIQK